MDRSRYRVLPQLVAFIVLVSGAQAVLSRYCDRCEEDRCPQLNFCLGEVIKDHCDCCNVCSSDTHQPHVIHAPQIQPESSCKEVTCPKYKICVENVQKLPLCSCASPFSCSRKRREVCGKDGETYHSRCHLRIAACKLEKRIKVKHRGPCRADETANEENDDDDDTKVSSRQKDYNLAKIGRKKLGLGRTHSGGKGGGAKTGKGTRKWKKERKHNKNRKNRKEKKIRLNKRRRRTKRERRLKNKRRYRSHSLKSLKRKYRFLGFNWKTGKWM